MKICPKCSKNHEKPGTFCSRSCANSRGPRSQKFKDIVSLKLKGRKLSSSHIENSIKGRRIKDPTYACYITKKCAICNSDFLTTENKNRQICFSNSCASKSHTYAGQKSAQSRTKRSKDEIELFEMCKTYFSSTQNNMIIADGW